MSELGINTTGEDRSNEDDGYEAEPDVEALADELAALEQRVAALETIVENLKRGRNIPS